MDHAECRINNRDDPKGDSIVHSNPDVGQDQLCKDWQTAAEHHSAESFAILCKWLAGTSRTICKSQPYVCAMLSANEGFQAVSTIAYQASMPQKSKTVNMFSSSFRFHNRSPALRFQLLRIINSSTANGVKLDGNLGHTSPHKGWDHCHFQYNIKPKAL